jgi:hypothetical protein
MNKKILFSLTLLMSCALFANDPKKHKDTLQIDAVLAQFINALANRPGLQIDDIDSLDSYTDDSGYLPTDDSESESDSENWEFI